MKLGYANVAATLALVFSIAGGSYAALELPRHSVGRAQLKPGAVDRQALAFPVAAAARTKTGAPTLTSRGSDDCPPPLACVPPPPPPWEPLASVRFKTQSGPGVLLISGLAGLYVASGTGEGTIQFSASIDGTDLPQTTAASVPEARETQGAYAASAPVRAGQHVLTLNARMVSFDNRVALAPVTLHATILPRATQR